MTEILPETQIENNLEKEQKQEDQKQETKEQKEETQKKENDQKMPAKAKHCCHKLFSVLTNSRCTNNIFKTRTILYPLSP